MDYDHFWLCISATLQPIFLNGSPMLALLETLFEKAPYVLVLIPALAVLIANLILLYAHILALTSRLHDLWGTHSTTDLFFKLAWECTWNIVLGLFSAAVVGAFAGWSTEWVLWSVEEYVGAWARETVLWVMEVLLCFGLVKVWKWMAIETGDEGEGMPMWRGEEKEMWKGRGVA